MTPHCSDAAPPRGPTDAEAAAYITAMCEQLKAIASRRRLRTIAYLLDMVRLESERAAEGSTE